MLLGDLIVSVLQIFLLYDLITTVHTIILDSIDKQKKNQTRAYMLIFVEILLPTSATMIWTSITLYQIATAPKLCVMSVTITVASVAIMSFMFCYALTRRQHETLQTMYIVAYCSFLLYKCVTYTTDFCGTTDYIPVDNMELGDCQTVVSNIFLYLTLIYGLIRKDNSSHFFYFFWVICREESNMERTFYGRTNVTSDASKETDSINGRQMDKEKVNPNETLLDFSFQCESGDLETQQKQASDNSQKKQEPAPNSKTFTWRKS